MDGDGVSTLSRRSWLAAGGTLLAAGMTGPTRAATPADPARLSLNENVYGPSPAVATALARAAGHLERYVEQHEVDALIRQIAAFEQVRPEQVVLGELLESLGLFLARQRRGGGRIVYSAPGYTALVDAAAPLGGIGFPVPLDARLANDLPALARAIDDATLAVSIINPHNPSGTASDAAALDAFVRTAAARTLVVVDEAYLEYHDLAQSAVGLVREGLNVLVFRTFAKIHGLAGLAFGYALAPAGLASGLRAAGIGAPHSLNRLALAAASSALADRDHVQRVSAQVRSERRRLVAELDRQSIEHSASVANFVFFRSPRPAAGVRAALAARGILVARPFPPLDEWIRITIGRPADTDAVIAALRSLYARG